jgi:hypothetical protein
MGSVLAPNDHGPGGPGKVTLTVLAGKLLVAVVVIFGLTRYSL